jgi:hypothetical protein
MAGPIMFPRFTGSQGVSTGTQYPAGWTSQTTISTNTTPPIPQSLTPTPTATMTATAATATANNRNVGAIVGGVVGCVVAVCMTALAVTLIVRSRRRSGAPVASQPRESGADNDGRHGWGAKAELPGTTQNRTTIYELQTPQVRHEMQG